MRTRTGGKQGQSGQLTGNPKPAELGTGRSGPGQRRSSKQSVMLPHRFRFSVADAPCDPGQLAIELAQRQDARDCGNARIDEGPNHPGACHTRATRQGDWRSVTATYGYSRACEQANAFAAQGQAMPPIFQAGHEGSIPFARSERESPGNQARAGGLLDHSRLIQAAPGHTRATARGTSLRQLAGVPGAELAKLHGMGPKPFGSLKTTWPSEAFASADIPAPNT
jgi:hypothetical protein